MTEAVRAPKTIRHFEQLRLMIASEAPPPPIAELVGFRLVAADLGQATVELDASSRHANPMGTLHGGVICDIADAAMGCALASTLEDDETYTSLDLTAKFFKPIWSGRIRAAARLTRRTRTLAFLECEVVDESGSLVAKLFSSCVVLRGQEAEDR